jgi:drug/metabolite transporter (DMT)-like permease
MALTSKQKSGFGFAFLGVFLFSASLPLTKLALEGYDPLFTAFARPIIAAIIAIPLMVRAKALSLPRFLWRPMVYTTLGAVFGWPIFIALALQRSTSAHVAVIAAVMPLVTALIAVVKHRKRPGTGFWIASTLGTVLLVLFALSRGGAKGENGVADLLTIVAVFASAYCYVEGAGLTAYMPGWQVISWIVIIGTPLSLVGAMTVFVHTHQNYAFHWNAFFSLLGIGLSSMYLGFFAWYRGLKDLGVAHGSQVQQLQAIMTLGWSALLLHERVSLSTVLAAVGIVLCVLWAITTANSD